MATTLAKPIAPSFASVGTEIVALQAAVQNYAWGLTPSEESFVADLHARNASTNVDNDKPYAELWIGTHPSGPARLQADTEVTLAQFLEKHKLPSIPYLFKVLSVAKPLSIQAHPDKELAVQLHERNPKAYKDKNHKPEMCIALTEFEGMCNFRPVHEIRSHLEVCPELAKLCKEDSISSSLEENEGTSDGNPTLKSLFSSLMNSSEEDIGNALTSVVKRLGQVENKSEADSLFLRLVGYYPGDVGCFAAYLLNYVRISPGQAFFMAANEPHAYLKGQCVEIMATSDNVVRAGLTGKFKDVPTLIEMLTYQDGQPTIMTGVKVDDHSFVYQPPAREFQVTKCVIRPGTTYQLPVAEGPGIVMCLDGAGTLSLTGKREENSRPVSLYRGSIYYIAPGVQVVVEGIVPNDNPSSSQDLVLFRAGVNES